MRSIAADVDRINKINKIRVMILSRFFVPPALLVSLLAGGASAFQTTTAASTPNAADEVVRRILREPVGSRTLADFNYPDDYLHRVADRFVRSSFEQRFRMIVPDYRPTSQPFTPSVIDLVNSGANQFPTMVVILAIGISIMVVVGVAARRLSRRARR